MTSLGMFLNVFVVHAIRTAFGRLLIPHAKESMDARTSNVVSLSLKRAPKGFYTVSIDVNRESKRVLVDSGSGDFWVRTRMSALTAGQGRPFEDMYSSGTVSGRVLSGTVSFQTGVEEICDLGVLLHQDGVESSLPFVDGIWGLAPEGNIEGLVQCLQRRGRISFRRIGISLNDEGGVLQLGYQGVGEAVFPLVGSGTWSVRISELSVEQRKNGMPSSKTQVLARADSAILDTGSRGIHGPPAEIDRLILALGAQRFNDGTLRVHCKAQELPAVNLRLQSKDGNNVLVQIPAKQFLRELDSSGWCSLDLAHSKSGLWILGDVFFRQMEVVVFDYEKNEVSCTQRTDAITQKPTSLPFSHLTNTKDHQPHSVPVPHLKKPDPPTSTIQPPPSHKVQDVESGIKEKLQPLPFSKLDHSVSQQPSTLPFNDLARHFFSIKTDTGAQQPSVVPFPYLKDSMEEQPLNMPFPELNKDAPPTSQNLQKINDRNTQTSATLPFAKVGDWDERPPAVPFHHINHSLHKEGQQQQHAQLHIKPTIVNKTQLQSKVIHEITSNRSSLGEVADTHGVNDTDSGSLGASKEGDDADNALWHTKMSENSETQLVSAASQREKDQDFQKGWDILDSDLDPAISAMASPQQPSKNISTQVASSTSSSMSVKNSTAIRGKAAKQRLNNVSSALPVRLARGAAQSDTGVQAEAEAEVREVEEEAEAEANKVEEGIHHTGAQQSTSKPNSAQQSMLTPNSTREVQIAAHNTTAVSGKMKSVQSATGLKLKAPPNSISATNSSGVGDVMPVQQKLDQLFNTALSADTDEAEEKREDADEAEETDVSKTLSGSLTSTTTPLTSGATVMHRRKMVRPTQAEDKEKKAMVEDSTRLGLWRIIKHLHRT